VPESCLPPEIASERFVFWGIGSGIMPPSYAMGSQFDKVYKKYRISEDPASSRLV
jgi:hypothetical protein